MPQGVPSHALELGLRHCLEIPPIEVTGVDWLGGILARKDPGRAQGRGRNGPSLSHGMEPFEQVLRLGVQRDMLHMAGFRAWQRQESVDEIRVRPPKAKLLRTP